jgi:hypothetical protein
MDVGGQLHLSSRKEFRIPVQVILPEVFALPHISFRRVSAL